MATHITRVYKGDFIGGDFAIPTEVHSSFVSLNPGNKEQWPLEISVSYDCVGEVIESATIAKPLWAQSSVNDRKNILKRFLNNVEVRQTELAILLSTETGAPIWESRLEIRQALVESNQWLEKESRIATDWFGLSSHEKAFLRPRGVFVMALCFDQPVLRFFRYLIPSLLLGNVVVVIPPQTVPITLQTIAEIVKGTEFASGVFNLIQGDDESIRRLVVHSGIDGVIFQGEKETGLSLLKQVSQDKMRPMVIEPYGHNATVLLQNTDVAKWVTEILWSAYSSAGQRFSNSNRVFVPKSRESECLELLHQHAKNWRVDYGLVEGADSSHMGPLQSEAVFEQYLRYQGIAIREGAEEVMRGKALERNRDGFYVSPSIHFVKKWDFKQHYQKTRMLGPNLAVYGYQDLEEVVRVLNKDSQVLVTSVMGDHAEQVSAFGQRLNCPLVHVGFGTHQVSYDVPMGGKYLLGNSVGTGSISFLTLASVTIERKMNPVPFYEFPENLVITE